MIEPRVVPADQIRTEPPSWLWADRVPRGECSAFGDTVLVPVNVRPAQSPFPIAGIVFEFPLLAVSVRESRSVPFRRYHLTPSFMRNVTDASASS